MRSDASAWSGCLFAVGLCACAGAPPDFPTAPSLPAAATAPLSISVEPQTATPHPSASASSTVGLVVLRTPVDRNIALPLIRSFFRAVTSGDPSELDEVVSEDASTTMPRNPGYTLPRALAWWTTRMQERDYTALVDDEIYREGDVTLEVSDTDRSPVPGETPGNEQPGSGAPQEIIATVRILSPRVGALVLFGDTLVFHVARAGERLMITRIDEDYVFQ